MTYHAKVTADGTIVVPHEILQAFGIKTGDSLLVETTADALVIRPEVDTALGRLRAVLRGYSVDRFLADRRVDWSE